MIISSVLTSEQSTPSKMCESPAPDKFTVAPAVSEAIDRHVAISIWCAISSFCYLRWYFDFMVLLREFAKLLILGEVSKKYFAVVGTYDIAFVDSLDG